MNSNSLNQRNETNKMMLPTISSKKNIQIQQNDQSFLGIKRREANIWTEQEDELLFSLLKVNTKRPWTAISRLMVNKSPVQCRYRWENKIRNQIKTSSKKLESEDSSKCLTLSETSKSSSLKISSKSLYLNELIRLKYNHTIIAKYSLTLEQEYLLLSLFKIFGPRWTFFEEYINIPRRFLRYLFFKLIKASESDLVENCLLSESKINSSFFNFKTCFNYAINKCKIKLEREKKMDNVDLKKLEILQNSIDSKACLNSSNFSTTAHSTTSLKDYQTEDFEINNNCFDISWASLIKELDDSSINSINSQKSIHLNTNNATHPVNNIMDEKKSIIKSSECNNSFTQSSNMSISPSEEFFDITIYNNNSMNSWLNFDDNMFGFLTVGVNENE